MTLKYLYCINDLPENAVLDGDLAIDTEAMGLNNHRDRLCLVQISDANQNVYLIHFQNGNYCAPNLRNLLIDNKNMKIFHFARFDVAIIRKYLDIRLSNVFCTKLASRLCRTYTNYHSLSDLCMEMLNVKISKQQQSSDWGASKLKKEQLEYATRDVLYLHQLRDQLTIRLARENRLSIAQQSFKFLPYRAELDLLGWADSDIFSHH